MRITLVFPALLSLILVSGCLGGGGGGGGAAYYLTAGDYITSGGAVPSDGCGLGVTGPDLDGNTLAVTTGAGVVLIDGDSYTRNGNAFARSQQLPGEQVNPTCTVDVGIADAGSITTNDSFSLTETIDVSNPVGAGCAGAIPATLPCTTQLSFQADLQ